MYCYVQYSQNSCSIYFLCIIYLQAISTFHLVTCEVRHSCPPKILWKDVSSLFCPNNTNYYHCLQIKYEETYEDICKRPIKVTPGTYLYIYSRGHRGCDHMVVGFTTTYAISAYYHWCLTNLGHFCVRRCCFHLLALHISIFLTNQWNHAWQKWYL